MSIKNIYKILKNELAYQYYSKMLLLLIIPLLLISFGYIYFQYQNTEGSYRLFLKTEAEYKQLGIDIQKALDSPVKVKEGELKSKDGDGEIVENILRYDYENFVLSLHNLQPKQAVVTTMEWMGFILFPLAFTLYAIYISSYDIRFKTVKIKAVRHDWKSVLLAKQCSVYMVLLVGMSAVLCAAYVSSLILYSQAARTIPVDQFTIPEVSKSNILLQFIVIAAVSFIFTTIGFYLGILLRSFAAPALLYIIYSLLVPVLGKFDLKNLLSNLGHAVFNFNGHFKLFTPVKVEIFPIILILAAAIGLLSAAAYYAAHRQSKYVV
ncbi:MULTISPECIES: ABC transporter permease [Bacillus]|uniref:ABC transporter permease n=1 Tax=Bacillus TaxID=1386 RepID=UPI00098A3818|nr:ABC transporter permease [Bacillus sonorensis]